MPQDSLLADFKKLEAVVNRLAPLETPAPGKGTWSNRPTAPVVDQEYTVTDRNHETYYWFPDTAHAGANANWLSTRAYEVELRPTAAVSQPQTFAVNTAATHRREINNFRWSNSYVVDHAEMTISQAATTDLTRYCTINFNRLPSTGVAVAEIQVSSNVAGKNPGNIYNYLGGGNLASVFTSTTAPVWTSSVFLIGASAGAIILEGVSLWIRLVG